ncbi:N-methylhydantoinase B [Spinactinospora alkalitolerans]|uniref:N-methylhydantoinase B n=1 Tax=Spinactinospora alkalitolerans TaxID=687207 RepID=A0A852U834_9ACTN|nr:hydantoinase B/oxoprolinase family protein [Spinactinospora alkalitolerans]NYE50224.1 N-methylhydantoinase B [Spinactinospora alkalitolerans]
MTLEAARMGVLKSAYESITREMAADLKRAAFSSIVREARDFSVALTDRRGEVIVQAECIPIMTAGISLALRGLAEHVDIDALTPDDALLMNDPYSGGQHLQDIYLFTPIFLDGRLVAFAASVAHHVDVGGGHAGLNAEATEVYQEGLRLPLSRFSVSRDWGGGFVDQLIRANVRVPDLVIGDLNAQFAANRTAERRFAELTARHGAEDFLDAMDELKDYAERRVRAAIARIPDGVHEVTEYLDASPWDGGTARVIAHITVDGDELRVDFDGSSPQINGNVNCPFASTVSAAQSAIRCMLDDQDLPFNEGCNRPITITAPYGSILNPRPPAAVRARLTPASRVFNAIVRGLGSVLPGQAVATGFDTTTAFAVSHLAAETGHYQVVLEILGGGWGACAEHDGADALDNPISNCANSPVEALETDYDHFRIAEYALVGGSGGDGAQRGGLGIRRVYEALRDGVRVSGYADRHRTGASGLSGGTEGGTGDFSITRADGTVQHLDCVFSEVLDTGDRIAVVTGGGGGFGDPAGRPADQRAADRAHQIA